MAMGEWTIETLKEYLETLFSRRDREIELARQELGARLEAMNEFRRQIERERGDYVSVDRYDEKHVDLERRIGSLETWRAGYEGGSTQTEKDATRRQWALGIMIVVVIAVANGLILFVSSHP